MKNREESMGSGLDQCEASLSTMKDKVDVVDHILDTLKMRRCHESWIQQLLGDSENKTKQKQHKHTPLKS